MQCERGLRRRGHFHKTVETCKESVPNIVGYRLRSFLRGRISRLRRIKNSLLDLAPPFKEQEATTMPFAQLVLGSPGAGKSTFCNGSKLRNTSSLLPGYR